MLIRYFGKLEIATNSTILLPLSLAILYGLIVLIKHIFSQLFTSLSFDTVCKFLIVWFFAGQVGDEGVEGQEAGLH